MSFLESFVKVLKNTHIYFYGGGVFSNKRGVDYVSKDDCCELSRHRFCLVDGMLKTKVL